MRTSHSIIAALAILAGPAMAQETADTLDTTDPALLANEDYAAVEIEFGSFEANELIGKRVYASEEGAEITAGLENGWDDIGEVGDLLLSESGELTAVLVDVGGFLGIGEKVVAAPLEDLSFYTENGGTENFFVVYGGTREALETQDEWTPEAAVADADMADDDMADDDMTVVDDVEVVDDEAMADDGMTDETMDDETIVTEGEMTVDGEEELTDDVVLTDETTGVAQGEAEQAMGDDTLMAEGTDDAITMEGTDNEALTDGEVADAEAAIPSTDEALESDTEEMADTDMDEAEVEPMTDEEVADADAALPSTDEALESDADMVAEGDADMDMGAEGEFVTDETIVAEGDMEVEGAAEVMSDDAVVAEGGDAMWDAPQMEMEGYSGVEAAALTAEDLQGAPVFGAEDDRIGKIADVMFTEDGMIEYALIDVGGFLGIGKDQVQVGFDELQILNNDAGDDLRVFVAATEDQMKARAEEMEAVVE
ncbi:PRC-barrel domain-containing protein [Pseudoroseicyclus tamaricis]|uniref:PRC-barrel domain-containing protein n=1 Tax=Pseudoroseicyclus tamaricis TaxID=2705421 RepID=A0A6B2JU33_9RHOB|nr:PRC-barrel domain-containing protein [Pseudoroseicyclus tamaricis]NDV01445.1 hypothetical protein [Pseudoroseicyclus tamaricis]